MMCCITWSSASYSFTKIPKPRLDFMFCGYGVVSRHIVTSFNATSQAPTQWIDCPLFHPNYIASFAIRSFGRQPSPSYPILFFLFSIQYLTGIYVRYISALMASTQKRRVNNNNKNNNNNGMPSTAITWIGWWWGGGQTRSNSTRSRLQNLPVQRHSWTPELVFIAVVVT